MVDNNKDFNFNDEVTAKIEDLNHLIESTVNKSLMSSKEALDYINNSIKYVRISLDYIEKSFH